MEIIPVIDLQAGQVVHARRGERGSYRPIESPLCRGSDPLEIASALLDIHSFANLYIADLDAIQRHGDNAPVIAALHEKYPQVTLWVDNGLADAVACRQWLDNGPGILVIGSETQGDIAILDDLAMPAAQQRIALSLDFRADRFVGPPELLARTDAWPNRVIVMTLARVGSAAGPDMLRLQDIVGRVPGRKIFAAGGVRGGEDLIDLIRLGIAGVLVATALHERRLVRDDIVAAQSPA